MALRASYCSVAVVWFLLAGLGAASAQGSYQDREACTADVFRLCGAYIPDTDRITDCLRASGHRLSPACYEVFHRPPRQTAPPPESRRRYDYPPPNDDDGF